MEKEEKMDWLALLGGENQLAMVMDTNQYTKQFGVVLSNEDAEILCQSRKRNLREEERVEFGGGILPKLIFAFCDSPYLYQDNYVESLERLQEIFYLYKNESLDELTDDELVEYMCREFHGICQGSLDYLEDTVLENFARNIRCNAQGFMSTKNYQLSQMEETE